MFLIDKYSINDPWDVIYNQTVFKKLLKLDDLSSWLDNDLDSDYKFNNLPNIMIYGNEKKKIINLNNE